MAISASNEPFGLFYAWWRGDPLPRIDGPDGLTIAPVAELEAERAGIDVDAREIKTRIEQGNRLYVGCVGGEVVGWGWSASVTASIGELGIHLDLPPGNRYLWDFVTLPDWRGHGIYPRLLQSILIHERDAERFWVGHDYDNAPSGRGILRAGFQPVGAIYEDDRERYFSSSGHPERALLAAELLGVPVIEQRR